MHSPHVDQVTFEYPTDPNHPLYREGVSGTDFMVPCDPAKPGQVTANKCKLNGTGKYSLVSKFHRPPLWPEVYSISPKDPDKQLCVSCHRIGSETARKRWGPDSVGNFVVMDESRTEFSKTFPESHWMPYLFSNNQPIYTASKQSDLFAAVWESPSIHSKTQKDLWETKYGPSSEALTSCLSGYPQYQEDIGALSTVLPPLAEDATEEQKEEYEEEQKKLEKRKEDATASKGNYENICTIEPITHDAFVNNQSIFQVPEFFA